MFYRLTYRKLNLKPVEEEKKRNRYDLVTELPKLTISCPPGFGLSSKLPHLCGKYNS